MPVLNRAGRTLTLAILTVALVAAGLPREPLMGATQEVRVHPGPELVLASATDVIVDSQPMRVQAVEKDYAFSNPASDVYRFEVRKNDFGWDGDEPADNRRSELVSEGDLYYSGETLWSAFSFVVGPENLPFDPEGEDSNPYHNIVHQWHSVDTESGRSPVFAIELRDGNFTVSTRSDDDPGRLVTHYSETRPADGAVHDVVVSGLLGSEGHLTVWLDGRQVVDEDTAIGYYDDDAGLAYPHWGIYQKNVDDPAIVYHANIEWGIEDLSGRVTAPPDVIEPPGGWV